MISNSYKVLPFGPILFKAKLSQKEIEDIKSLCSKDQKNSKRHDLAGHIYNEYSIDRAKLNCILKNTFDLFYDGYSRFYNQQCKKQGINDAWVNYMKKGDFNPLHTHSKCVFSGVIYLNVPKELQEEQNKFMGNDAGPGSIPFNLLSYKPSYFIGSHGEFPREGDIYIFPAGLEHTVAPFKSEVERISVAFNTNNIKSI